MTIRYSPEALSIQHRLEDHVKRYALPFLLAAILLPTISWAQPAHSVARQWNDALLDAIRIDTPRPTVHARNLFHTSAVMYDAWAAYDDVADPYLLGRSFGDYTCPFVAQAPPANLRAAREEAISYATYRLLVHRFSQSPGAATSLADFDALMNTLGFDPNITSTDYVNDGPAALGNYIGACMIEAGRTDYANESANYSDYYGNYAPVNEGLIPDLPGNPTLENPNRWQPLILQYTVDGDGNVIPGTPRSFLSPDWAFVTPFALQPEDLSVHQRDGNDWWVYHDPGSPPSLALDGSGTSADYQWNFELVSVWSSHLDPDDGVMWDISPASLGNINSLPTTAEEYEAFYNLLEGGDPSVGHAVNPATGEPYEPQMVPRGDYTRVLAEFWADGPASETPPGHWYTIYNEAVADHPQVVKRFKGTGDILDDLEYDVKAYFVLGGATHDAAVTTWGIKSYYDYLRPISAIRSLAARGQRTNESLDNYHPAGIELIDGLIEVVEAGDPLAGTDDEHVGKIKLNAWRGPDFIPADQSDHAGVGWILAENWWPYQKPSFITPPFAGYTSGHSMFSRTSAEVLTRFTGDPYFPGGMGVFVAPKNEFLKFEEGPSVDVVLQWATYRDASDQTSLSRIWGGIHPPVDDIPGRKIGDTIAADAMDLAERFFLGQMATSIETDFPTARDLTVYPSPVQRGQAMTIAVGIAAPDMQVEVYNVLGQRVWQQSFNRAGTLQVETDNWAAGTYLVRVASPTKTTTRPIVVF